METKICTSCNKELPATTKYFHKLKNGKYGLASKCKECRHQYNKEYRENTIDYQHERNKIYRENNKEKEAERKRKYVQLNQEKVKKYSLKYYEINKDRIKKWSELNKDKISERQRTYYKENKNIIAKRHKEWANKNPEKCNIIWHRRKSRKNKLPNNLTIKQWTGIKSKFNNKCAYCGNETKLEQEHFIPLSKGGEYTVNNIIPACKSCNCSKHDKDFFDWYPKQEYYSEKREKFILNYLGYKKDKQQLALNI